MAAAKGNNYAGKSKQWAMALERALDARGAGDRRIALDALAETLLAKADSGDLVALKELGDRLDGKAAQAIVGDVDQPVAMAITWGSKVWEQPKE